MVEVKNLRKESSMAPSQWIGDTKKGNIFYARYRFGILTVSIIPPKTPISHKKGVELIKKEFDDGKNGGVMETKTLKNICSDKVDFID